MRLLHERDSLSFASPTAGAFIVFEGVDKCGKTTQCNKLMEHLKKRDVSL